MSQLKYYVKKAVNNATDEKGYAVFAKGTFGVHRPMVSPYEYNWAPTKKDALKDLKWFKRNEALR